MKKLYYFGLLLLAIFEISNVYFIMPMPGSQEINSISIAYTLYSFRWVFRIVFGAMIIIGFIKTWDTKRKWVRIVTLIPVLGIVFTFNFVMTADKMFLQPSQLILKNSSENLIPTDRLIIGITHNGESKAYPVEFLAYHHQVQDSIGGKPVIVTYCSVCRTGRVFEPMVDGKQEKFRLVGMDHFNAMFEDATTGSWWRQATGEAITGNLKGKILPEFESVQMTLAQWLELYPNSLIMQEDPTSAKFYDQEANYEKGNYEGGLTGTDKKSWEKKSWVVGVQIGTLSKAYDWNKLLVDRIINDEIGDKKIVVAMADDQNSFVAFERPSEEVFTMKNDTLYTCNKKYNFAGVNYSDKSDHLKKLNAYQEFWHSWKTFHPNTKIFN